MVSGTHAEGPTLDAQDEPVAAIGHDALQALTRDTGQSFQDLIDKTIVDLLKKHKRPVAVKGMLCLSLEQGRKRSG
jgi:hypothetical protein